MDHYLTTYNKDYIWPTPIQGSGEGIRGGGHHAEPQFKASPAELDFLRACLQRSRPPDCRCPGYSSSAPAQETPAQDQDWNRIEIMGPLLDPKLFPARVGATPEVSTSRYDQPNAFLDKLEKKFPMLYSILQSAPTADLKARIERDRNKTTYQMDYCEKGPGAEFASLQRAGDASGTAACSQPMRLPGDPCRVRPAPRAGRTATITKNNAGGGGADKGAAVESSGVPPMGKSEYQDGVSKVGGIIMRDKLHRKGK